ncbi:hypothetical protein SAMN05216241_10728 [Limimonas halophila]|uniref:Phasin domain-containing protein n=1 Tax=Limimonas halophila TaxID=1082479 RepID=A0A1G7SKR7_9PROT|nr:phasin family protein [Limimonas halophila]SDG23009.1 hypothetical protein SAMN05216241_10728 [Limimonas halophila]
MSQTKGNPFFNGDVSALFDPRTYLNAVQVPGVDTDKLAESQRKNIDAVTEIQRTALAGAQQLVQRQMAMMRQMPQPQTAGPNGGGDLAAQTDAAKTFYETTVRNLRELAEVNASVQQKAFEVFNTRMSESFDELRDSMKVAA